jgi:N-acetyl-anhydromuramyl-L-alanine amidase AmpD
MTDTAGPSDPSTWRTLKQGMSGLDVVGWKQTLLGGDAFDAPTHEATRQWQRERGLKDDGVVGPATREVIGRAVQPVQPVTIPPPREVLPGIKFVQAKHYRQGRLDVISNVVIHSAETSERPSSAEALGAFFQNPMRLNNAGELVPVVCSAHYSVDSNSIIQHVLEGDTAFHVRAKGWNDRTIGVELTGRAAQSREEWLDEYGKLMLPLAAKLVRWICDTYGLPFEHVGPSGLLVNTKGITSHVDIRDAFHTDTHYDPGGSFPWDVFVELVQAG